MSCRIALLTCLTIGITQPRGEDMTHEAETLLSFETFVSVAAGASPGARGPVSLDSAGAAPVIAVSALEPVERFYDIELKAPIDAPLSHNQPCLVSFAARAVRADDETSEAAVHVYVQSRADPGRKSLHAIARIPQAWTTLHFPFAANGAWEADQLELAFGFGDLVQQVEIRDIRLRGFGPATAVESLPGPARGYAGDRPDAAWRAEARRRIERFRMADICVTVRDSAGNPAPGAAVRCRQTGHAFRFGSLLDAEMAVDSTDDGRRYREVFVELFNQATAGALKMPAWHGQWPHSDPDQMIAALRWAKARGFPVHGHVLIWPSFKHVSRGVAALADRPESLRVALREHIIDITERVRPWVDQWDVLNEPFANHEIIDLLGPAEMTVWFTLAHTHAGGVPCLINDYGILAAGGLTNTSHQRHFKETIRRLLDNGAPLGGIGLQGHFGAVLTPPATVVSILDELAAFDLPIHISEFDITMDDPEMMARYTRDFMTAAFSHPAVAGLSLWGFWAGYHWRPRAALYDRDWNLRPHGEAFRELVLAEWRTDTTVITDNRGRARVRGFRGEYEISATAGSRTVTRTQTLDTSGLDLRLRMPAEPGR